MQSFFCTSAHFYVQKEGKGDDRGQKSEVSPPQRSADKKSEDRGQRERTGARCRVSGVRDQGEGVPIYG
jgi:hypothetical protein